MENNRDSFVCAFSKLFFKLLYSIFKLRKCWIKKEITKADSPSLVVGGETLNQKVVSSNPIAGYWMDIFHIYLL